MEARPYQIKLKQDIKQAIRDGHRRIIVQLHVGGGKTFIAADIIKGAINPPKLNRTLFLAPRRQLVYQTVDTLGLFDINSGFIMAGESKSAMRLSQVASFDTVTSRVANERMDIPQAKVCIVDEAHACFSPARLKLLENYPLVLGFTATPALANGKGMGAFYTTIVEGPTMAELVEGGYLVPMRYFGAESPDLAGVLLNSDGDYQEKQLADATDKPELIGAVYDNYKRIAGDRTTLIFAVNRKHAVHIHDEFKSHGVEAEYIDGNTPTEERDEIKRRVESGKTKVIVNIGVMAFGTDWPIISCVIIARVTRNISAWIQMAGRGSRLHPSKQTCLIIYHGPNFDELGRLDDPISWSLDDKSTIRERKEKAQQEAKAPKEIKCNDCGTIFSGRRTCPNCGHEMVNKGEAIPFHAAELKELKADKKPTPEEKAKFYAELIGYCRQNSKPDKFALAIFQNKFHEWPYKKNLPPLTPTQETIGFIKHCNISYAKRRAA